MTEPTQIRGLTAERRLRMDYHQPTFTKSAIVDHDGIPSVALRTSFNHGEFYLQAAEQMRPGDDSEYGMNGARTGTVYQPLHPSLEAQDIMGATYAWDDGTYWHIAHCSPHEQMDFAKEAERFTYGEVQDAINRAQATLGLAHDDASRAGGKGKVDALINFAYAAGRDSYLRVRISGFVSLLFMPAIIRLRVARSTISDITL